jgi:hypothetical protein
MNVAQLQKSTRVVLNKAVQMLLLQTQRVEDTESGGK